MNNKNNKITTNVCGNKDNNDRSYNINNLTVMMVIVIIAKGNSNL